MVDRCLPLLLLLLAFGSNETKATRCPDSCICSPPSSVRCFLGRLDDIATLKEVNATELTILVWPLEAYFSNRTTELDSIQRSSFPPVNNSKALSLLLLHARHVSTLLLRTPQLTPGDQLPRELLYLPSLRTVTVETSTRTCTYQLRRQLTLELCRSTCARTDATTEWNDAAVCACALCVANDNISGRLTANTDRDLSNITNATAVDRGPGNTTNMTTPGHSRRSHTETYIHTFVIGSLGVAALVVNFFFITRCCVAKPMSPLRVFALGLFLFDCCIAEYGIAVAAFLSQEDTNWNMRFCSGVVSVKIFGIAAAASSMFLMTYQKVISSDTTITKRNLVFKSIVYVLEGMVFGGMLGIIAWTKFSEWSYLCSVVYPRTTVDQMLIGIEAMCFIGITLLVIRYPYHKIKHCRDKEKKPKPLAPGTHGPLRPMERDFPIYILILVTVFVWCASYLVTVPTVAMVNEKTIAFARTCSLLLGALLHPILFALRDNIKCDYFSCVGCNKRHRYVPANSAKCRCRGIQTCGACTDDFHRRHARMHRRRSLSMDDLHMPKMSNFSLDAFKPRKAKTASKSFPLLSSPIDEEDVEDGQSRVTKSGTPASPSMPEFLSTFLHGNLSSNAGSPEMLFTNQRACGSLPTISTSASKQPMCGAQFPRSPLQGHTCPGLKPDLHRKFSMPLKIVVCQPSPTPKHDRKPITTDNECSPIKRLSPSDCDRNRISRVPTFIPFDEPGPSGVVKRRDSNASKSPRGTDTRRAPLAKFSYSTELNGNDNDEDSDEALNARVAERQPFCNAAKREKSAKRRTSDEKPEGESEKQIKKRTKQKKRGGVKGKGKQAKHAEPTTTNTKEVSISMDSLEWDPILSSSSASSPLPDEGDTISSPVPPAAPSAYAIDVLSRQSGSSFGSGARDSRYSMDWDPTAVQKVRESLAMQCDWEPYSVDEPSSNGEAASASKPATQQQKQQTEHSTQHHEPQQQQHINHATTENL